MKPTLKYENRLKRKGYKLIAGVDEAGRGSWVGPIVAAAVILPDGFNVKGIKDSKLLNAKQRENLYNLIRETATVIAVSFISHKMIDKKGIGWANQEAIKRVVKKISPDYALIDGRQVKNMPIPLENIVNGDRLVKSIAAASIIAKVTRDKYLAKLDSCYPEYGFARHKGYGTREHYEMICKHGVCEVHRHSYLPIRKMLQPKKIQKISTK